MFEKGFKLKCIYRPRLRRPQKVRHLWVAASSSLSGSTDWALCPGLPEEGPGEEMGEKDLHRGLCAEHSPSHSLHRRRLWVLRN